MHELRRPFSVLSALWISFLLLIVMTALSLLMALPDNGKISGSMLAAATGIVNLASFLALSAFAFHRYGIRLRVKPHPGTMGLAVSILMAAAGLIIVLSELDNILKRIFPAFNLIEEGLIGILTDPPFVLSFLLLSVVAPVTEEIFFRGILLEGLKSTYGTGRAVIVSSLCFAFVHLNPVQFSYTFVLGIFLGYVYVAYGSVLPGILIHAVINFIPLLFIRLVPVTIAGFTETAGDGLFLQPPLLNLTGIMLSSAGTLGMYAFFRNDRKNPRKEIPPQNIS